MEDLERDAALPDERPRLVFSQLVVATAAHRHNTINPTHCGIIASSIPWPACISDSSLARGCQLSFQTPDNSSQHSTVLKNHCASGSHYVSTKCHHSPTTWIIPKVFLQAAGVHVNFHITNESGAAASIASAADGPACRCVYSLHTVAGLQARIGVSSRIVTFAAQGESKDSLRTWTDGASQSSAPPRDPFPRPKSTNK